MLTKRAQRQLYDQLTAKAGRDIADAFLEALQQLQARVSQAQLADAIERGDLAELEMLLRFDQGTLFPVTDATRTAYVAGARSTTRIVRGEFGFEGLHERAEEYVRTRGGELVTGIDDQQREMLREVMEVRVRTGESGAKTARRITGKLNRATQRRQGGFIGLSGQQTRWALNAEDELRNLSRNYFTRRARDRRYDAMVRKAIAEGRSLSESDIDRIIGRYKDRLLQQRGRMIARTEAHGATALGQWEQFEALREQGINISARWVHGGSREPRTDHLAMGNAPSRRAGQPFVMADGTSLRFPHDPDAPAHHTIGCKCSLFYRIAPNA